MLIKCFAIQFIWGNLNLFAAQIRVDCIKMTQNKNGDEERHKFAIDH